MFRSTSEANVATVVRFCQTLLQKIHESYHNFLILYAKQSIMFFSTRLVLFQNTACSRCPSADFVVPVKMSQISHVFGGFFSSKIDNIQIKHAKYIILFLNIIYLLQLTHENHQHSNFLLTTNE